MRERRFATITVSNALYAEMKRRAKKENRSLSAYAAEFLQAFLSMEDRFSTCESHFRLISIREGEVILRDNKKDTVVGVKGKEDNEGRLRFYCELDDTDYCEHTAFDEAIPQVRRPIRR